MTNAILYDYAYKQFDFNICSYVWVNDVVINSSDR